MRKTVLLGQSFFIHKSSISPLGKYLTYRGVLSILSHETKAGCRKARMSFESGVSKLQFKKASLRAALSLAKKLSGGGVLHARFFSFIT